MPRVVFVSANGEIRNVDAAAGTSVMQAAVANDVRGIIGECGGSAMCATCHCYVDQTLLERLPPISAVEHEMLEATAAERRANSRLGCQIELTDAVDGIIVHLPERQT